MIYADTAPPWQQESTYMEKVTVVEAYPAPHTVCEIPPWKSVTGIRVNYLKMCKTMQRGGIVYKKISQTCHLDSRPMHHSGRIFNAVFTVTPVAL